MKYENWLEIAKSENFWGGVFASILAAIIVGIAVFIFRSTLKVTIENRRKGMQHRKMFEEALDGSSAHAPFAYGVAQAIALKNFVLAVFIAYIGDIMGIFWPLNIAFYALSLVFIWIALRWLFKIQRSALKIFGRIKG